MSTLDPSAGQPFGKRFATPDHVPATPADTEFEQARGLNRLEVRPGFASVRVDHLADGAAAVLEVLQAVADAGIIVDFVKLAAGGVSFVIKNDQCEEVRLALQGHGENASVNPGKSVLIAFAVNMRDEEGLVAKIVSRVLESGVAIEHLGDMHDRLLIVIDDQQVDRAKQALSDAFLGGA